MTDRLRIRFTSFALAAIVTFSMLAGIDTLAQEQHASGMQMSQAHRDRRRRQPRPAAQLTANGLRHLSSPLGACGTTRSAVRRTAVESDVRMRHSPLCRCRCLNTAARR